MLGQRMNQRARLKSFRLGQSFRSESIYLLRLPLHSSSFESVNENTGGL